MAMYRFLFTINIMNARTYRLSGAVAMTLVFATSAVGFGTQTAQAAAKPACITNYVVFPRVEEFVSGAEGRDRVTKLQAILAYEGYSIASSERSSTAPKYGPSTAAAVVDSQKDHLSAIKTLSGTPSYKPTGYVDPAYEKYLESEYGCSAGTFSEVTYPDGGESFEIGKKYTITWKTDAQIKSSAKIDIKLIDESSSAAKTELIQNVANTGKFDWTVPARMGGIDFSTAKSKYRIEIAPTSGSTLGNGAIDRSDAQFTIGPSVERFTVVTPVAGSIIAGSSTTTKVTAANIAGASSATVRLVKKGSSNSSGTNLVSATNVTNLVKGVAVTIPESTSEGDYRIVVEVRPTTGSTVVSESAEFKVLPKTTSITVSDPKGTILQGASTTTNWTFNNIVATTPIVLKLIDNSGNVVTNLVSTGALSAKKATIKIPATATPGSYKVRLEASIKNGPTVTAESPSFTVTAPNLAPRVEEVVLSKQMATSGSAIVATWKYANIPNNTPVVIKLVDRNDREVSNLATAGLNAASKKATLIIPSFTTAGTYKVRVTANVVNGTPVSGLSGEFEIQAPDASAITIATAPKGSVVQGASTTTTWTFAGMLPTTPVVIRLVDNSGSVVTNLVSTGLTATTKKSTFKIPATVTAGTYRIRVDANIPGGRTISATSDSFSVTVPDLTPKVSDVNLSKTVATSGSAMSITWMHANMPNNTPIVVKLVDQNGREKANLITSGVVASAKKANIIIPTTVTPGTYFVNVTANVVNGTPVTAGSTDLRIDAPDAAAITITSAHTAAVVQGATVTTTWNFVGMPATTPVVIRLVNDAGSSVANLVSTGLTAATKKSTFKIPATVAAGTYKIRVDGNIAGGQTISATSDSFSVTAPDLTPTLSGISLSTSAVDTGGSVTVNWVGTNMVATVPVVVKLVKENGDEVANLVSTGLNVGSKKSTFKIPTSVSAGTYKVRVTANIPNGASVSALTDNLVVSLPVPTLTATLPTGGTVVSGKATTTRWTIANIPATTPVVIALVNASDDSVVANLVSSGLAASALTRAVTIPATVADGSYKLRLTANVVGGQSVTAFSSAFTVDKP
jgi:hypothetical protein